MNKKRNIPFLTLVNNIPLTLAKNTSHLNKLFHQPALVLVAPNHEIDEPVDEVLREIIALAVLGSVLVQRHQVEPLFGLFGRPQHQHLVLAKEAEQPFVLDRAHSVQGQLGLPLAEQQRCDGDL